MINAAVNAFQSLFSDPLATPVSIRFRYATTEADGTTPLPSGTVARSTAPAYCKTWSTYISALTAPAEVTTANDTTATASLLVDPLSVNNIVLSSANGRAIGLSSAGVMCANGKLPPDCTGTYDRIVTLNSSQPLQFTRPVTSGTFDALAATEHEMDEVLGLGSILQFGSFNPCDSGSSLRPQDLFTWSAPNMRNLTSSGSRYFSIDGGATPIVDFNQGPGGDFGDWGGGSSCPKTPYYVQYAFGCQGQQADVTATSPEGINLDVIGYDLISGPTPTRTPTPKPTKKPTRTKKPTKTPKGGVPTNTPPPTATLPPGAPTNTPPPPATFTFTPTFTPGASHFVDNGDGTISDTQTGLMWEKKDQAGGIHDWGTFYTWCLDANADFSCDNPGNPPDGTAFTVFLATLNTPPCFAGHCDWRLPTVAGIETSPGEAPEPTGQAAELESLLAAYPCSGNGTDPCVPAPFNTNCTPGCSVIDCSCTMTYFYWSGSNESAQPGFAWDLYFGTNGNAGLVHDQKAISLYVRAVR